MDEWEGPGIDNKERTNDAVAINKLVESDPRTWICGKFAFRWYRYSSAFTLKLPEKDVNNIMEIMRGMPEEERERRRREMDRVWLQFTYQRPPQRGDAFYSVMRELSRKKRAMRNGVSRFWD